MYRRKRILFLLVEWLLTSIIPWQRKIWCYIPQRFPLRSTRWWFSINGCVSVEEGLIHTVWIQAWIWTPLSSSCLRFWVDFLIEIKWPPTCIHLDPSLKFMIKKWAEFLFKIKKKKILIKSKLHFLNMFQFAYGKNLKEFLECRQDCLTKLIKELSPALWMKISINAC